MYRSILILLVCSLFVQKSYAQNSGSIGQPALNQIACIEKEKGSWTPVQQKISSHLLYAFKIVNGQKSLCGMDLARSSARVDDKGMVYINIVGKVTKDLINQINNLGGEIKGPFPERDLSYVYFPLIKLEILASFVDVKYITTVSVNDHDGSR